MVNNTGWRNDGYGPYWAGEGEPTTTTREEIEAIRQERYRAEADPIYLEAQEIAARTAQPVDLTAWLAKKDEIRAALPYPN